jgi:hypothetical protein
MMQSRQSGRGKDPDEVISEYNPSKTFENSLKD